MGAITVAAQSKILPSSTPCLGESNSQRQIGLGWLGWLIGTSVLSAVVVWANPRQVLTILSQASPRWLLTSAAIGEVGVLCGVLRLRLLARLSLRFADTLEVMLWSVVGNYLSFVKGAAFGVRTVLLKARGVEASRSLAGISLEVMYDLAIAVLLALSVWLVSRPRMTVPGVFWWWVPAGAAVALIGWRLRPLIKSHTLASFIDVMRAGMTRRILLRGSVLTLVIFFAYSLALRCVARAVGFDVPWTICLLTVSLGTLVGLLSSLPGGLGISDLTNAYALSLSGMPVVGGLSVTLLNRAVGLGMTFSTLAVLRLLRWRRRLT